jgi:hypothetical protein
MEIPDPFQWLSDSVRPRALVCFLVLAVILLFAMYVLDQSLLTTAAPRGILSLEFAKRFSQTQRIIASWQPDARTYAALSLGIDYLFLIVYALFISLACTQVARSFRRRGSILATAGYGLAWAQFVAAICDAVENYALIQLLLGSLYQQWPVIAWTCATAKFGIIAVGWLYILVGGLIIMRG